MKKELEWNPSHPDYQKKQQLLTLLTTGGIADYEAVLSELGMSLWMDLRLSNKQADSLIYFLIEHYGYRAIQETSEKLGCVEEVSWAVHQKPRVQVLVLATAAYLTNNQVTDLCQKTQFVSDIFEAGHGLGFTEGRRLGAMESSYLDRESQKLLWFKEHVFANRKKLYTDAVQAGMPINPCMISDLMDQNSVVLGSLCYGFDELCKFHMAQNLPQTTSLDSMFYGLQEAVFYGVALGISDYMKYEDARFSDD